MTSEIEEIERALVRLRRSQTRRALARATGASAAEQALGAVVDAVDEAGAGGVGAVGQAMGVDPSRASRLVAKAVDAGLVRRVASQADGRRSDLELTAAGRAYLRAIAQRRRAMVQAALEGWSAQERRSLAELLARFTAGLSSATDGGDRPRR